MSKVYKIVTLVFLFACTGIIHAQYESFVLRDRYNGFESRDGKGYIEEEIRDSASMDSYIASIYSTLAESYPRANIQVIGNRIIRMDATSKGISIAYVEGGVLQLFVDFSIVFEIKDHPEQIRTNTWVDSLGVTHKEQYNDFPHVRISAPVVKKLTVYNPYYKPEIKQFITNKTDMYDALMEKTLTGVRANIGADFISEIDMYIRHNIHAELNQKYYRDYNNGEYSNSLGKKYKRLDY